MQGEPRPVQAAAAPLPFSADSPARETQERQAAWQRGERRAQKRSLGRPEPQDPKQARAGARVAERAFTVLADNVRDYAVFLLDADGVITFWGEGARLMKWWSKDEAEGGHLRMMYPDGGAEDGTAEAHLEEAARLGEYTGEGQRVRSDGSTFWAGVTLTALRVADGTLLGFAKVTRDLTARRAADAALAAASTAVDARLEAEEESRARGEYLATMSHELRTPIGAILGYAELLAMEVAGPLTSEQRKQLDRIRTGGEHLLGLINEVLDYSRLEAGHPPLSSAVAQLGAAVEGACTLVRPQAAAKDLDLANEVSGASADTAYWGDQDRVRQILVNVLGNAIKFTPPGGRIVISAGATHRLPHSAEIEGAGPWAYIRVEDNGPGIPADRLEAIFEAFTQASAEHTRRYGGTGLGLAISRRLARAMAGDITVQSRVGRGSSFTLWLPVPAEHILPPPRSGEHPTGIPATVRLLEEVREAILAESENILNRYKDALRHDRATPGAHALGDAEILNHMGAFLSDIAHTLAALDLARGAASELLRDGTAIQRLIAIRHGVQRRRLGWSEAEVHREFEILREELAHALRRRIPREREVEQAVGITNLLSDVAKRITLGSFRQASARDPVARGHGGSASNRAG